MKPDGAATPSWTARTERNVAFATLAVLASVGALFASRTAPQLGVLIPSLFVVATVCSAASVLVLLESSVTEHEREASRILAFVFAVSSAFTFALALVTPVSRTSGAVLHAPAREPTWLYVLWHVFLAVSACYYAFERRQGEVKGQSRAVARILFVGFVLATGFAAVLFAPDVDALSSIGTPYPHLLGLRLGPFLLGLCTLGVLLVGTLRNPSPIDRAFTLTMVAICLEVALYLLVGDRYAISRYMARGLIVVASASVLVSLMRALLFDRIRLLDVQSALEATTEEAGVRAAQFRALWRAATVDGLSDADYSQAITDLGTVNLRQTRGVYGYVSHLNADELIIEAISYDGAPWNVENARSPAELGLDGSFERQLARAGKTLISAAPDELGIWKHAIGTPIAMGGTTHFLIFASREPMEQPFAEADAGFVEVLGSQIAHRYYQQDQYARIRYQLEHDSLTGLINLPNFRKELRLAIAKDYPLGIVRLNLDRFAEINETEGHMIGDEILVEVAAMLNSVEPNDVVARMSGDDFVVILHEVATEEALAARVERYRRVFDAPFHTGDRDGTRFLPVTCSLGAALYPRDRRDYEGLMQCADVALDAAKKRGGSAVVLFSDSLKGEARERRVERREILESISTNAFVLEYQPTFDLATRAIVGAEALIRWNHPTRGRLLPGEFIPFAERNGVIRGVSRWVLGRLIKDLSSMQLPPGFRCYMNLPANLLDDAAFLSELESELSVVPSLAHHLGIEVTESEAMQNVERAILALRSIRRRGLRVAIDDFGTGYSSLAYLKRLPIDMVKLDRSFVDGIPNDEKDVGVTELFLGLTSRMGVISLAEGIETDDQADWLREHGCRFGQGFLISRSLPIEELRSRLAQSAFLSHQSGDRDAVA